MKTLTTPPPMVVVVAHAVMLMFGEKVPINEAIEKVWKKA